jgi:hypothetical protein
MRCPLSPPLFASIKVEVPLSSLIHPLTLPGPHIGLGVLDPKGKKNTLGSFDKVINQLFIDQLL